MQRKEKIEKFEYIADRIKVMKSASKKLDNLYSRNRMTMSKSQNTNTLMSIDTELEVVEDCEHEIHCTMVELGLAQPEPERYRTQEKSSRDGWNKWTVTYREPKK